MIADREAYLTRLEALVRLSDEVKVSDEHLDWLSSGEPAEAMARRWVQAGWAWCWSGTGWRVGGPTTAALVWRRGRLSPAGVGSLDVADLGALLELGVRIAAGTCTRSGAEPPRWHLGRPGRG